MTLTVRLLVLVLAVLVVGAADLAAQRCDVTYTDGKGKERTEQGAECETHTYRGLLMKRGRSEQLVSEDDLISVTYARTPDGWDRAWKYLKDGKPYDAMSAFDDALADVKRTTEWARQEILWEQSKIAYRLGQLDKAKELADRLMTEVPESRYVPHIRLRRAEDLHAVGDFAAAATAFGELFAEAKTKAFAPSFVARAGLGRVRALLDAGKIDEAASALGDVRSANLSGSLATDRIALVEAAVLVARKDHEKAKTQFQTLLSRASAGDAWKGRMDFLLAGAANGLGDVAFEQGDFARAAEEYSKVFALFDDRPALEREVAWSMWRFAEANKRLANQLQGDESKREAFVTHSRRHQQMRTRVANDFPATLGGQLARRELGIKD